jgi:uncharacterized membrane protein YgcG
VEQRKAVEREDNCFHLEPSVMHKAEIYTLLKKPLLGILFMFECAHHHPHSGAQLTSDDLSTWRKLCRMPVYDRREKYMSIGDYSKYNLFTGEKHPRAEHGVAANKAQIEHLMPRGCFVVKGGLRKFAHNEGGIQHLLAQCDNLGNFALVTQSENSSLLSIKDILDGPLDDIFRVKREKMRSSAFSAVSMAAAHAGNTFTSMLAVRKKLLSQFIDREIWYHNDDANMQSAHPDQAKQLQPRKMYLLNDCPLASLAAFLAKGPVTEAHYGKERWMPEMDAAAVEAGADDGGYGQAKIRLQWLDNLEPKHLKQILEETGLDKSGNRQELAARLRAKGDLTKNQLQTLCGVVGVSKRGNKPNIEQRICAKLANKAAALPEEDEEGEDENENEDEEEEEEEEEKEEEGGDGGVGGGGEGGGGLGGGCEGSGGRGGGGNGGPEASSSTARKRKPQKRGGSTSTSKTAKTAEQV